MPTRPTRPRRVCAALLAAAAVLSLAACGGGDDETSADEQSPEEVLELAKATLDETSGLTITLSTDDLPSGVTGITSAEGVGVHPPAFEGVFKLSVSGLPADAEVIAVDGTTYAKNSLLLPDWTEIDPADYGAPDPNDLMSEDAGFSALLPATTALERGESVRGGAGNTEILTEYTGMLTADTVSNIIPSAEGDFEVTYTVSEDGELRQTVVTGVFYEGTEPNTYTLGFDDYGTEKEIAAP